MKHILVCFDDRGLRMSYLNGTIRKRPGQVRIRGNIRSIELFYLPSKDDPVRHGITEHLCLMQSPEDYERWLGQTIHELRFGEGFDARNCGRWREKVEARLRPMVRPLS